MNEWELIVIHWKGHEIDRKSFGSEKEAHDYFRAEWSDSDIVSDRHITMLNDDGERSVFDDVDSISSDWEVCFKSGQQKLDVPGGSWWLSENKGWAVVKVTIDAAGPNASKPKWFPTEQRAKNWVDKQIERGE